ncbi:MAG: molecular chaperone DnaJ [Candidatus Heimdallarchaeota archaeon]|nr:molecular chaperone DnaJ [Candidatus Heimdallarchaeota archaeon]MCK5048213.1 molecular chaperone DnaJ [Candidatus Heimdallarchaeota archaeon]
MSSKRDYYSVLGVEKQSSGRDIKQAYRKAAMKWHPDRNDAPEAEDRFKEVNEAYSVLSDSEKRQIYDRFGHSGLENRGFSPSSVDISSIFNEIFGGGGGSIFDFFSGGSRQRTSRRAGPQKGRDVAIEVNLTFEEAALGSKKSLNIPRSDKCSTCDGSGGMPGTDVSTCSTCHGRGVVQYVRQQGFSRIITEGACNDCNGSGKKIAKPCKKCRGTGQVTKEESIDVAIPAGVNTGSRLRIPGLGELGVRDGPRGDLYVLIRSSTHEFFDRDGLDILLDVEISFPLAVLGGKIQVPTLRDELEITIPPGTKGNEIFRLRGKGIQQKNMKGKVLETGSQFVRTKIKIPQKLSKEQEKAIRALSEVIS